MKIIKRQTLTHGIHVLTHMSLCAYQDPFGIDKNSFEVKNYNRHEGRVLRKILKELGVNYRQQQHNFNFLSNFGITDGFGIGYHETKTIHFVLPSPTHIDHIVDGFKDIPERTQTIVIPNMGRISIAREVFYRILPLINGTYYHAIHGSKGIVLGLTDEVTDDDMVMIRLMI